MPTVTEALSTATTRELWTAKRTEREPQAELDPKAAEFKADLLFMFAIPTAVLSFWDSAR